MAKISELPALGGVPASADTFALVDDNVSVTKKVTLTELRQGLDALCAKGALSMTTPASVTVGAGVDAVAGGTTTLSADSNLFDMPANSRLRYTGTPTIKVVVSAALSITTDTNNIVTAMSIGKNGTIVSPSIISRKIGTGADVGAISLSWLVELATNDFVELFMSHDSGGNVGMTVEKLSLVAQQV